mmetsp:Transcript_8215/g.18789  ORF Transcript_8215/g.18789 Transcript_8215/m.18789 type:complete len:203 (+) Transcript_8215:189-797(+)
MVAYNWNCPTSTRRSSLRVLETTLLPSSSTPRTNRPDSASILQLKTMIISMTFCYISTHVTSNGGGSSSSTTGRRPAGAMTSLYHYRSCLSCLARNQRSSFKLIPRGSICSCRAKEIEFIAQDSNIEQTCRKARSPSCFNFQAQMTMATLKIGKCSECGGAENPSWQAISVVSPVRTRTTVCIRKNSSFPACPNFTRIRRWT